MNLATELEAAEGRHHVKKVSVLSKQVRSEGAGVRTFQGGRDVGDGEKPKSLAVLTEDVRKKEEGGQASGKTVVLPDRRKVTGDKEEVQKGTPDRPVKAWKRHECIETQEGDVLCGILDVLRHTYGMLRGVSALDTSYDEEVAGRLDELTGYVRTLYVSLVKECQDPTDLTTIFVVEGVAYILRYVAFEIQNLFRVKGPSVVIFRALVDIEGYLTRCMVSIRTYWEALQNEEDINEEKVLDARWTEYEDEKLLLRQSQMEADRLERIGREELEKEMELHGTKKTHKMRRKMKVKKGARSHV